MMVRAETQPSPGAAIATSRPLRIAMLCPSLPVPNRKPGGVEWVAHNLANGLTEIGHELTMWAFDPPPADAAYQGRYLPWRRFYHTWIGHRLTLGGVGNLVSVLPDYRGFDVIVAHGDSLLLPLKGIPVIRIMHGSALGEALSAANPWRFAMQLSSYVQELMTAATQPNCVAVSRNTRRFNPFIRRVIPNSVDLNVFFDDLDAKTPGPSLVFVGTLGGRKRGALLLEWFQQRIQPQFPSAKLWMVSEAGPPIEGVTYFTGISTEHLAQLFREAWVFLSPSTYEGFGIPYLEAMASGTPVVATPNPGSKEVCGDGEFGCLAVDAEFADVVCNLLSDPARRAKFAGVGLERARHYSLDRMIRSYEELLIEVCGRL